MALNVQSTRGGLVRIVPGRARTARVRLLAAGVSGRAGELNPGSGLSFGGILRSVAKIGVGAVKTGLAVVTGGPGAGLSQAGRELGFGRPAPLVAAGPCPTGFRWNGSACVAEGFGGFAERVVPGGSPGKLTTQLGEAVMGAFGLPAMVPAEVGTITRNDGTVGPILRCGRRMVLGSDNLCYPKALLSRRSQFRKWRLPTKPPVTGGDMAAIRRAARTRDRVKELAGDVGFTCAPKGGRRKKKGK